MGVKADDVLDITFEELTDYLGREHAVYIEVGDGTLYYITDCNEHYWRVQYTNQLNDKGHYTDASELVPTVGEFVDLKFGSRELTLREVFAESKFFASVKSE